MSDEIRDYVANLARVYPWITESTMEEAFAVQSRNNLQMRKVMATIRNNKVDYSDIVNAVLDGVKTNSFSNTVIKELRDVNSGVFQTFEREDDIARMGELAFEFSKGFYNLAHAANELEDYFDVPGAGGGRRGLLRNIVRRAGKGIDAAFDAALWGSEKLVYATAGAGIGLRYLMEQEKTVRAMLDFGMVAGDLRMYNQLRDQVAGVGMSVESFLKETSDFNPVFANLEQDTLSGALQFSYMAEQLMQDDSFSKLGYRAQDFAVRLAEEAAMLRRIGQIETLALEDQAKIADSFSTSSQFALILADSTGEERDELLQQRNKVLENLDLVAGIDNNYQEMVDQFGEDAPKNISNAIAHLSMLMQPLPPDFKDATIDTLTRAVYDFKTDADPINNVTVDLNEQMTALGTEARELYYTLLNNVMQGLYDSNEPEKITKDYLEFLKAIKDSNIVDVNYLDVSPNQQAARFLQDVVTTFPDNHFVFAETTDRFNQSVIMSAAEKAATVVNAVNNLAVFNAEMRANILPEYTTVGTAVGAVQQGLETLSTATDLLRSALGDTLEDTQISDIDREIFDSVQQGRNRMMGLQSQLENSTSLESFNQILQEFALGGHFGPNFQQDIPASDISHLFNQEAGLDNNEIFQQSPDMVAARMTEALVEQGITDPRAISNILGMVSGESGFQLASESSYRNTSIARIREVLASRAQFYTDAELEQLKQDDRAFYDAMYGEEQENRRRDWQASGRRRLDTGTLISDSFISNGDLGGYDFRGRGYVQITGRGMYQRIGDHLGIDLVGNPDLANDPYWAPRIAAAYYGLQSDAVKGRLVDPYEVYRVTWGQDPRTANATKMADAQRRASVGRGFLARLDVLRNYDTSLTEEEIAYISRTRDTIAQDPSMIANATPSTDTSIPLQPQQQRDQEVPNEPINTDDNPITQNTQIDEEIEISLNELERERNRSNNLNENIA